MPTQQYALEPNGPKLLAVSWRGLWKNLTITYNGALIGTVPGKKELTAGQTFAMPDGSQLHVQLASSFGSTELRLMRNGRPLPGSAGDPLTRVKTAAGVLFFIAGLNIVLGLLATVLQIDALQELGIGIASIVFGVVFALLGWFVRRQSLIALILAIGIFILDALLGMVLIAAGGGVPLNAGLIVRVFLLLAMIQGVPAIRQLHRERQQVTT